MGGGQSVRASDFQRPSGDCEPDPPPVADDFDDDNHISISNKMVERLVDDATIECGAAVASAGDGMLQRTDYKDKIYMERLRCLDDSHSERYGLTMNDARATATRIELRTANMINPELVCGEMKNKVLECFAEAKDGDKDYARCWETVGAFTKCVQESAAVRLRKRTARDARETARRERHVALAREHVLKDITAPSS